MIQDKELKATMNTHGVIVSFGKYKGELLTRVPVSYLKFMINTGTPQADSVRAEFNRRGDTMPRIELTGHAIDNASIRARKIWISTRLNRGEGIYSWLQRISLEAIEEGEALESGQLKHRGMKFVIEQGAEFPVVKTVMV